ncbi:alpha/beta hydrolase fold-domain-containing protein [Xylariaceae sp. FL1019]|nr:alpha/beta hydrolase fold-domain-containing protein [Xylariaceae sp. FL1019]
MSTVAENDQTAKITKARRDLFWQLLPKIPAIARVVLLHVLRISETSKYLNLETDITLTVLRAVLHGPRRPLKQTQALTLLDPGVKGRIWISRVTAPIPPETGIRDVLLDVIHAMSETPLNEWSFGIPDLVPVEAEWTGYRAGVKADEPLPEISEEDRYEKMMAECRNKATVLYMHGGAFYLCDPSTHRPTTKKLAKLTGGRVYSVRYRLAPQHPFPAALLDMFVAYFTLLYPPPGSMHQSVVPEDIVFAGDSAGGGLALSLVQLLLELRRQDRKVPWYGLEREVPLPAGVTCLSPWTDVLQSMPSWERNQKWDFLGPPNLLSEDQPPPDSVWPSKPPRRHLYAPDALLMHPLVSPHLAKSWADSPPMWIVCGWECLADEDKYLVAKLTANGVPVVFEEYEAMPHTFCAVLPKIAGSVRCYESWAGFIKTVTGGEGVKSKYTYVEAKSLRESEIEPNSLTRYGEKDASEMAAKAVGMEIGGLSPVTSKL